MKFPSRRRPNLPTALAALAALVAFVLAAAQAPAETRLKSICRVKGQEENVLQGMGLVLGLKGTGDGGSFLPEIRALSRVLQLAGAPLGDKGPLELKDVKNVALVMVTATVPPSGGRQGDKLNCRVMSIGSAKSLEGGQLYLTPLTGPTPGGRVYAVASGSVTIDAAQTPTSGIVHNGCRLEEDFFNPYLSDGRFTLVLDEHHADFGIAQDIADRINFESPIQSDDQQLARALDQVNIEVTIPPSYRNDPVLFLSIVLNLPIRELQTAATVVINERTGAIVIGEDVEIGSVVVSHRNVVIETGQPGGDRFTAVFPRTREDEFPARVAKLRALTEALNALKVPSEDVIDIIKGLERGGKLHGRLIVE